MMVMVTGTVTVMTMVMMTLMVTVMVRKLQMVLITIVARQPVPTGDEFYCGCIMQSPDQHLLRIALHYMYDLTESIPPPAASPAAQQRLVL